jgi:hypothetical protein
MQIDHTLVTPIKLVSEANMREHWFIKNKRKKSQQAMVQACWLQSGLDRVTWAFPLKITFTRIGVRKLDSDNLAGSGKAVRDQIAKLLGVNDGDESKVTWHYAQRKGAPKQYGLEVRFESA